MKQANGVGTAGPANRTGVNERGIVLLSVLLVFVLVFGVLHLGELTHRFGAMGSFDEATEPSLSPKAPGIAVSNPSEHIESAVADIRTLGGLLYSPHGEDELPKLPDKEAHLGESNEEQSLRPERSFNFGALFIVLGFIGVILFLRCGRHTFPHRSYLGLTLHFGGITAFYWMMLYALWFGWNAFPAGHLQIIGGILMLIGSGIWGPALCYVSPTRVRLRTDLMYAGLLIAGIGLFLALGWGAIHNGYV